MSSAIIWNAVLVVPFLLAFIAGPLWMSVKRPDRAPDHTAARRYLAAKGSPVNSAGRVATASPAVAGRERQPALARAA